jgi:hypothetical protein
MNFAGDHDQLLRLSADATGSAEKRRDDLVSRIAIDDIRPRTAGPTEESDDPASERQKGKVAIVLRGARCCGS